jgi:hypothetical protein
MTFQTETLTLKALVINLNQVRFIAGSWKKDLASANAHKAKFKSESTPNYGRLYDFKSGAVLSFRGETSTGIPGYHVHSLLKTIPPKAQVLGTFTNTGLTLEWDDEGIKSTTEILPVSADKGTLFKVAIE